MKVAKELIIDLRNLTFVDFYNLITENVNERWKHDNKREKIYEDFGGKAICFESVSDDFPKVGLAILQYKSETLSLPNIIPLEKNELEVEEYNQIFDIFIHDVIEPKLITNSFSYEQTNEELTLENQLDETSIKQLKSFCDLANKSTGRSHPQDEERWFAFIFSSFRSKLDLDLLEYELIKQGWSYSFANKLTLEYEFARDLLTEYENK